MSRSNPVENSPHPCTRWFEWDGAKGGIRFYDKEKKESIAVPDGFAFIFLDQLSTVKGWSDELETGIYANEVKDTRENPLVVKYFKGSKAIASGFYSDIKDKVVAAGGYFVANIFLGYIADRKLVLGCLQLKGAALAAWSEFKKESGKAVIEKAIRIKGMVEGQKGAVKFVVPKFHIADIKPETNTEALELDKFLQTYLKEYFSRTSSEKVDATATASTPGEKKEEPKKEDKHEPAEPEGDDVPF